MYDIFHQWMQLPTLLSVFTLGVSTVIAADYCTPVRDPYPRKANTGFTFSDDDPKGWEWQSRDVQQITALSQVTKDKVTSCQLHQGGGGGTFAQLVCIDFEGNYACWSTPADNEVCNIVFEIDDSPLNVCESVHNMWDWAA
ncbi:uncharacterized protein ColSpa_05135 [Colletotrichum spaethianum]|uniref:Uncharacterized protein n=1 Tax=Colletotrichum spaethianum TaxID=700344 RepID=A0AA37LEH1_9PEZI|nr:uncharacterized protein ColSpa_05135 [Colletotrichum spaethianum]GKT44954.1 hypothetical protein ColSpa_05135 [Colletotrichum spaethianum]